MSLGEMEGRVENLLYVITRVDSLLQSSPVMPNQGSGSPMIPGEIPGGTTNIK